jgi:RNA polymerase sigma factor (TIGR02999 family)
MAGSDVTRILSAAAAGDPHAAGQLLPLVYDELRKLATRRMADEPSGQTLQATALVHEAYLRLVDVGDAQQQQHWNGRGHFFAAAAEAMRRILVENARRKHRLKAGGGRRRVDLDDVDPAAIAGPAGVDVLALGKLERDDRRKAELVKLRYFAGLTNDQAAAVLGISGATAENDWAYARAWLRLQLGGPPDDGHAAEG